MRRRSIITAGLCAALSACAPVPPAAPTRVALLPTPYVKNPLYWPTPVMDSVPPALPSLTRAHAVLVFSKTNGFRDDSQIKAADTALAAMIARKGWDGFVTENAAVFNPAQLARFEIVVLNSNSGNVFTDDQRTAFRGWIESGGRVVALHGAGGDHDYDWGWYVDVMLGAHFIGHTSKPSQFRMGLIRVADHAHPAMRPLPRQWRREEEWYAFDRVPKGYRTHFLAWLDEKSYGPVVEQRMGRRHPIIWTRCIGDGRVFFSALGHKAETYSEPLHLQMIDGALDWAAAPKHGGCK